MLALSTIIVLVPFGAVEMCQVRCFSRVSENAIAIIIFHVVYNVTAGIGSSSTTVPHVAAPTVLSGADVLRVNSKNVLTEPTTSTHSPPSRRMIAKPYAAGRNVTIKIPIVT